MWRLDCFTGAFVRTGITEVWGRSSLADLRNDCFCPVRKPGSEPVYLDTASLRHRGTSSTLPQSRPFVPCSQDGATGKKSWGELGCSPEARGDSVLAVHTQLLRAVTDPKEPTANQSAALEPAEILEQHPHPTTGH